MASFNGFVNHFNSISGFIEDSWVLFLFSVSCHIICCVAAGKLFCTLVREQEERQTMLDHFDRNSFNLADPLKGLWDFLSSWKTLWEQSSEGKVTTLCQLKQEQLEEGVSCAGSQDELTANPKKVQWNLRSGRKNWVHFRCNVESFGSAKTDLKYWSLVGT